MREDEIATWERGNSTWGGRLGALGTVPVCVCVHRKWLGDEIATWERGNSTWGGRLGALGTVPVCVCVHRKWLGAYKEYYACATGEAAPKLKASARKKKGGSASSTTPPTPIATPTPTTTVVAAPSLPAAAKGVLDVPSDDLEKEISWNSSDDEDVDDHTKGSDDKEGKKTDESDDEDDDQDEAEKVNDDDDDEEEISKIDQQEATESGEGDDKEAESDGESEDEETREQEDESFDPIPRTPEDGKDDDNGKEDQGLRISEEERMHEEEEADELYRDVDINQGRGLQVSQDIEDSYVTLTPTHFDGQQESSSISSLVTSLLNPIIDPGMESIFTTGSSTVTPIPSPKSTMTSSIITTTTTTSQPPIPPTPIPSDIFPTLLTFALVFCFKDRVKSLEVNFSNIPGIVHQYMHQQMPEAVREAVQIQTDRLQDSIQRENDEFLRTIDDNMKKIIKEQVKSQVKAQVTRILPRIELSVNAQLEAKVLTRSSHSSRTLYAVAADLSKMELKKILIDKMEGNKTPEESEDDGNGEEDQGLRISEEERVHEEEEADELYRDVDIKQGRGLQVSKDIEDSHVTLTPTHSDGQQKSSSTSSFVTNLLNLIIDPGMESIFTTGSSTVTPLPSPKSTMTPSIITTTTTASQPPIPPTLIPSDVLQTLLTFASVFRFEDRVKSLEVNFSELMRTNQSTEAVFNILGLVHQYMHKEITEAVQEAVQIQTGRLQDSLQRENDEFLRTIDDNKKKIIKEQPRRPPTPDHDWNKTLQAAQRNAQSWISALAKQTDARSSFNELLDTPIDFSKLIMNRLSVDTLTPELLACPTNELMRGHESALDVYSKRIIIAVTDLKIVNWHNSKHLDWISIRRDDDKIYKFKEGDFKRLRLQDIEDMLLLLVQRKLSNLTIEERFAFNVSLRMFTRSIVIQRRMEDLQLGFESFQKRLNLTKPDTDKKNKLMRIDELHKFNNGTLNDVRNALDDRLKGIRMQYLPTTI
nr:hypothetical protein [Tanacetum cinerariifolium]